jgi:hypothetical protein
MNFEDIVASGENTLVRIEMNGIWRQVTISREAVEDFLLYPPEFSLAMTADQRCSFVRRNLPFVFAAARLKIHGRADARNIWLTAGDL